ncbi:MAG: FAD:protein FMN transferase [Angustibacter sp.]
MTPTSGMAAHAPDPVPVCEVSGGTRSWVALGTYVQLATSPVDMLGPAVGHAREVLDEVDAACSRFRADSDLVRANARAGRPTDVSPLLAAAVAVAVDAARQTDGLVDPTLGLSLVAAGYDRDIALLPGASHEPSAAPRPARTGAWREIVVDPSGTLTVPVGCALDLGATGKAWASDLVAASVAEYTGADVVVSLGGDVAVAGPTCWPVTVTEVADRMSPMSLAPAERVQVGSGGWRGLATSTTIGRRWSRGGQVRHHLLDPRTGESVTGQWRTVSAFGRSATAANIASTAALLLGADAWDWLVDRGVAARLVDRDAQVRQTPQWAGAAYAAMGGRGGPVARGHGDAVVSGHGGPAEGGRGGPAVDGGDGNRGVNR